MAVLELIRDLEIISSTNLFVKLFKSLAPGRAAGGNPSRLMLDSGVLFNEQLNQTMNTGTTNEHQYCTAGLFVCIRVYSWFKKNRVRFIIYLIYTKRTKAKQDPETQHVPNFL